MKISEAHKELKISRRSILQLISKLKIRPRDYEITQEDFELIKANFVRKQTPISEEEKQTVIEAWKNAGKDRRIGVISEKTNISISRCDKIINVYLETLKTKMK